MDTAADPVVLEPHAIYFFYSRVEMNKDPLLLERYWSVISGAEKAKCDRYVFEKDRLSCLVTRALVRFVLSVVTGLPPGHFQFTENAHGKPALEQGCVSMPIRFNLSHSRGLTACAVALDRAIGVDVEHHQENIDLSLAERYFTLREADYIRERPPEERAAAFFDLWTLKEAYIKARGMGLSIDLDQFGYEINPEIRVHMDSCLEDTPDRWRFFRFSPEADYHAAIAVQGYAEEVWRFHVYRCVPFVRIDRINRTLHC